MRRATASGVLCLLQTTEFEGAPSAQHAQLHRLYVQQTKPQL